MMVHIDADKDGVIVVYKIGEDNDVEDIRVFQHYVDAKWFIKTKNETGWKLWQRPIE